MDGYNAQVQGLDGAPVAGNVTLAQHYWQLYLAAHHNTAPHISIAGASSQTAAAAIALYQTAWKQTLGVPVQTYYIRTILGEGSAYTLQLSRFAWVADYPDPRTFSHSSSLVMRRTTYRTPAPLPPMR